MNDLTDLLVLHILDVFSMFLVCSSLIIQTIATSHLYSALDALVNSPRYLDQLETLQVRFLTTDSGTLRLHPQLYADGKVRGHCGHRIIRCSLLFHSSIQ